MWRNFLKRLTNLPLAKGDFGVFIPYFMAFFVFLSSLGVMIIFALKTEVGRFEDALQKAVTLQIFAPQDASLDNAEAYQRAVSQKAEKVEAFLKGRIDIDHFEKMNGTEVENLLKPWLVVADDLSHFAMPTLIKITPKRYDQSALDNLAQTLKSEFEGVHLDYRNVWIENLIAAAKRFIGLMVVGLMAMAFLVALMIAYMARIGFALHRKNAEILSLMGASAAYIRQQFSRYIVFRTLQGFVISTLFVGALFFIPGFSSWVAPLSVLPFVGALYLCVLCIVWLASFGVLAMNVKKLA